MSDHGVGAELEGRAGTGAKEAAGAELVAPSRWRASQIIRPIRSGRTGIRPGYLRSGGPASRRHSLVSPAGSFLGGTRLERAN